MTQNNDEPKISPERISYDNLFKTVLHRYFWDGLEIFSPALHADADTSKEPEFMEQELEKVAYDHERGPDRTDLLVRVPMKNGSEQWLICHLELQHYGGGNLPERMNRYRALIYLKHGVEPVAIAVLTAPRPKNEPCSYAFARYDTRIVYEYGNIDVRSLDDDALLSGNNRIALILYAAKRAQESKDDEGKKFRYLRDISNIWAGRGWPAEEKRVIMLSIEYLINLKDHDYARQMAGHFKMLEKEGHVVEYVTIAERVYKAEGWEKGRVEGMEKGREEGIEEGKLEVALTMLRSGVPMDDIVKYTGISRDEVQRAAAQPSLIQPVDSAPGA